MTQSTLRISLTTSLAALLAVSLSAPATWALPGDNPTTDACDKFVPVITKGYGANGRYGTQKLEIAQKGYDAIPVFVPKGLTGRLPVVFFSHGYGPNAWRAYEDLINHTVSRGYIFVFSPYPMNGTMENRYATLWNGMTTAVQSRELRDRVDLTRVGFVGHSFGGGANPTMAYKGFVEKGWGKRGGFMLELAPWYTYYLNNEQIAKLPQHVLHGTQVYEEDLANDHRMAIDVHSAFKTPVNLYFSVTGQTVNGCKIIAEHSAPGQGKSYALKQYAVFRPLDALAAAAFEGGSLAGITAGSDVYSPVRIAVKPQPVQPESYYMFPWTNSLNPRAGAKSPVSKF